MTKHRERVREHGPLTQAVDFSPVAYEAGGGFTKSANMQMARQGSQNQARERRQEGNRKAEEILHLVELDSDELESRTGTEDQLGDQQMSCSWGTARSQGEQEEGSWIDLTNI